MFLFYCVQGINTLKQNKLTKHIHEKQMKLSHLRLILMQKPDLETAGTNSLSWMLRVLRGPSRPVVKPRR